MKTAIRFSRTDFVTATKWVLDIIDMRNDSASIQMKTSKGNAKFSGVSLQGERTYSINGETQSEDIELKNNTSSIEISAKLLRKAIDRLMDDFVTVSVGETSIKLSSGVDIEVPLLSTTKTRLSSNKSLVKVGTVSTRDFFDAVSHLPYVTDSSSSSQPRLACVDFSTEADPKKLALMSTDKFSMAVYFLNIENDDDGAEEPITHRFLIPASDLTAMKCVSDVVTISNDDTSALFDFGNSTALVYLEQDPPIKYELLIKHFSSLKGEASYDFNKPDLIKMIDTAHIMSESDEDILLTIDPADKTKLTITNRSETVKGSIDIENLTGDLDEKVVFTYGYNILKNSLQSIAEDHIRYFFMPYDVKNNAVRLVQLINDEPDSASFFMTTPRKR